MNRSFYRFIPIVLCIIASAAEAASEGGSSSVVIAKAIPAHNVEKWTTRFPEAGTPATCNDKSGFLTGLHFIQNIETPKDMLDVVSLNAVNGSCSDGNKLKLIESINYTGRPTFRECRPGFAIIGIDVKYGLDIFAVDVVLKCASIEDLLHGKKPEIELTKSLPGNNQQNSFLHSSTCPIGTVGVGLAGSRGKINIFEDHIIYDLNILCSSQPLYRERPLKRYVKDFDEDSAINELFLGVDLDGSGHRQQQRPSGKKKPTIDDIFSELTDQHFIAVWLPMKGSSGGAPGSENDYGHIVLATKRNYFSLYTTTKQDIVYYGEKSRDIERMQEHLEKGKLDFVVIKTPDSETILELDAGIKGMKYSIDANHFKYGGGVAWYKNKMANGAKRAATFSAGLGVSSAALAAPAVLGSVALIPVIFPVFVGGAFVSVATMLAWPKQEPGFINCSLAINRIIRGTGVVDSYLHRQNDDPEPADPRLLLRDISIYTSGEKFSAREFRQLNSAVELRAAFANL